MTAKIEAGPAVDPAHASEGVIRHPIVFMPLFAPFGISAGYVSVTLGFLLARAGVPTATIAVLIALSVWPQTWKMLWAPVVDTVGNPKLWYGLGTTIVGLSILAMSVLPATADQIPLFSAIIVASSIASTLVSMSSEIFLANQTPVELRGRASGWSQAGNLGGSGIGGGVGLLLAEHVDQAWISGAVLAVFCFACWAAVLFLPRLHRTARGMNYLAEIKGVLVDVWEVARSRLGYLALIIMVLPIASGAMPWSAVAKEWQASGNLVAVVNGIAGGVAAMLGALVAGFVCDRMDVKRAYCLFGLFVGAIAAGMAFAPAHADGFRGVRAGLSGGGRDGLHRLCRDRARSDRQEVSGDQLEPDGRARECPDRIDGHVRRLGARQVRDQRDAVGRVRAAGDRDCRVCRARSRNAAAETRRRVKAIAE